MCMSHMGLLQHARSCLFLCVTELLLVCLELWQLRLALPVSYKFATVIFRFIGSLYIVYIYLFFNCEDV